MTTNQTQVNLP